MMKWVCFLTTFAILVTAPRSAMADHGENCVTKGLVVGGTVALLSTITTSVVLSHEGIGGKSVFWGSAAGVAFGTLVGGAAGGALCENGNKRSAAWVAIAAGLVGGIGGPLLFNRIWGSKEADPETAGQAKEIKVGLVPIDSGASMQLMLRF